MPYILSVAKETTNNVKEIHKPFEHVDTKDRGFNIKKMT